MDDNATFLSKLFGGPAFEEQRDIDALRSCSAPNAYCCNEAGKLTGICATAISASAIDFPPMPHLEYLNVGNNKDLKSWTFTSPLPALMHFDASDSGLKKELSIPAGFNSLVWLDAARNEITDLVATGRLEALEHLDMSGNQLR